MPIEHPDLTADTSDELCGDLGPGPALVISRLSYSYPDGRLALADISLAIDSGERVALVGPNGAGKSTLLWHLNGLLAPEGRVVVAGRPVIRANLPQVRRLVGLVFQDPDDQLFSPTVYEDVAFGPLHLGCREAEVHERVSDALGQVGLSGYENRLSHHLSAGEKKRVAIATVLAMRPLILALDEPSSGLDPRARRQLIELLQGLGLTMLCATHDLALAHELCQRTIIMDEGRVVADGPTWSLFVDAALLLRHGLEPVCQPDGVAGRQRRPVLRATRPTPGAGYRGGSRPGGRSSGVSISATTPGSGTGRRKTRSACWRKSRLGPPASSRSSRLARRSAGKRVG